MTALRSVITDHWRALAAGADNVARFAVTRLPVSNPHGNLAAAIDGIGRRHLLVPVGTDETVEPDTRSAGVHLVSRVLEDDGVRTRFADLVLLDQELGDVFTSLCADVVGAVESDSERALRVTHAVFLGWRTLFAVGRFGLSPEAVAGLVGELHVLQRLLAVDAGALMTWTGPFGSAQDFHRGRRAIEVKATTALEGAAFRVHGLDQLTLADGDLALAWFRLERHPTKGESLPDLVSDLRGIVDDERAFLAALAYVGYAVADAARYDGVRFAVVEERWYRVDAAFPRLIANHLADGALAVGVSDVHYTVDLDASAAATVDGDHVIGAFLERA